jgi:hypothetical protein
MTTSTEDIADLVKGYSNLKTYFEGVRDSIDDRINASVDRWDAYQSTWYVDQLSGSDENEGGQDDPFATLQAAVNKTPYGRRSRIWVSGNYDTTRRYNSSGRKISVFGAGAGWEEADIDLTLTTSLSGNDIITNGFKGGSESYWELWNVNLKCKTQTQVTADHPGAGTSSADVSIFSHENSASGLPGGVVIRAGSIDLTADPYAYVLSFSTWTYLAVGVSYPSDPAGRIAATVASGTLAKDVGHILSNIPSF